MTDQPVRQKRPHITRAELLAMSRMLRLHLQDDKFFNPLDAIETKKLALHAMVKIETWRGIAR